MDFQPKTPCKASRALYLSRKCLTCCLPVGELKSSTRAKEQGRGGGGGTDRLKEVGLAQESEEGSEVRADCR